MRKLLLIVILVAGACGSVPPVDYPTTIPTETNATDLGLGPGDVLEIVVYNGSKEAKATYRLDAQGKISVQYIGEVLAANKKPAELESEIKTRLADGYLVDPIVSVGIVELNSQKVSVSGEIAKDGTVKYAPGMTIVDVIAQSGGFTPMAKKNHVKVIRTVSGKDVTYRIPVEAIQDGERPNFYVASGDRIFVPERIW